MALAIYVRDKRNIIKCNLCNAYTYLAYVLYIANVIVSAYPESKLRIYI